MYITKFVLIIVMSSSHTLFMAISLLLVTLIVSTRILSAILNAPDPSLKSISTYVNELQDLKIHSYSLKPASRPVNVKQSDHSDENLSSLTRTNSNQTTSSTTAKKLSIGINNSFSLRHEIHPSTRNPRNVVLTSWFSYAKDPQRGHVVSVKTIEYMYNLYTTAVALGIPMVVFHNAVPDSIVQKYSNSFVTFRKVSPGHGYSTNDYRFIVYNEYVKSHDMDFVLMVDASDVFFRSDPFIYINKHEHDHKLFMSPDDGTFHSQAWNVGKCYGTKSRTWDQNMKMHNAGVWGGHAGIVRCILDCVSQQLKGPVYGKGNCNMPVVNWCVSHGPCATALLIDDNPIFVNPLRKNCLDSHIVVHNKCSETDGKICVAVKHGQIYLQPKQKKCLHDDIISQQRLNYLNPQKAMFFSDEKDKVHVVYAADEKASVGVEASVTSLQQSSSEQVVIYFIGVKPLQNLSGVRFISLSSVNNTHNLERFVNKNLKIGIGNLNSLANYVRFVLPQIFPNISKIMWIDADTIVRCDVVPLITNSLTHSNHAIAAVPRKGPPAGLSSQFMTKIKNSFNAGVFVVDTRRWQEKNMTDRIQMWAQLNQKRKIYSFGSQPPMALAVGDDFEHLHNKWNLDGLGYRTNVIGTDHACILHWSGSRKHWVENGLNKILVHAKIQNSKDLITTNADHSLLLKQIQRFFRTRENVSECQKPKTFTEKSTQKMICLDNIIPNSCTVYSFGINYQWEFDDFMHDYGCVVRSFDPGMHYKNKRNTNHFFESVGIGVNTGWHQGESTLYSKKSSYKVETITSVMKRLGDTHIDLLCLDVESAEFDVLDTLPYDKIDQLSIEIHMWKHTLSEWTRKLQKIKLQHLQTFQNRDKVNPATMTEIAPGITRVYEMTFANIRVGKKVIDIGQVDVLMVSNYINCVTRAVINGLKSHLENIGNIHVIVPQRELLACNSVNEIICYEEHKILNPETSWISKKNKFGWTSAPSRRGWYYQQMLKLLAFQRIQLSLKFVWWDADNVLIKNYSPFTGTLSQFLTSGDGMPGKGQYLPTTKALIGDVSTRRDVVVHQMPINQTFLRGMITHICAYRQTEACSRHILDSIPKDAHPSFGISEYHLYYTWTFLQYQKHVLLDHEKKLSRTGKQVWTDKTCSKVLSAEYASDIFMVVLEQQASYRKNVSQIAF